MHTLALITFAAIWDIMPVRLIAISGIVYVLVQAVKQIFPALDGWKAITLNVVLSVTGVLSLAKPGDFESAPFWASLMITIAAAAGIHGTVKSIAKTATTPPGAIETKATVPAVLKLILIGCLLSGMTGCMHPATAGPLPTGAISQTDAMVYQSLKPAHDFAASLSNDIISGKLNASAGQKTALENLNKALNVADRAEQQYHAGGSSTAIVTTSVAQALAAWTAALTTLSH